MSTQKLQKLSESEWRIISALWADEPLTIMQLCAKLKEETGWSKNTVITLLKRMEAKNAVAYDYSDGAKHYYSLFKREDVAVSETETFLKRIYEGSLGLMLNSLVEQRALSKEDISELYDILRRAEDLPDKSNEDTD